MRLASLHPALLQETLVEELGHDLLRGAPFQLLGQNRETVIALRGGREDDQLRVGELHGSDPLRCATASVPSPPRPRFRPHGLRDRIGWLSVLPGG